MKSKCELHGVIPAIVTPMTAEGDVDLSLLLRQAEYLVSRGVNGLFVCGGTGEGAHLATEEKLAVFKALRELEAVRKNGIFLCAAAIQPDTRRVLGEIEAYSPLKPDFFVATAPFYYGASQAAILEHYAAIAAAAAAPVIVYNIPSCTHNYIELSSVQRLSELSNIAGVKDSSGNFINFSRGLFAPRREGFAWIQGEDYLCAPALLCGGDGMVSGLSNARVEPYVDMYRAALENDAERVTRCQAQINELYKIIHAADNGNAAIKAVTELYGRGARHMRAKSVTVSGAQYDAISAIMDEYDKRYGA